MDVSNHRGTSAIMQKDTALTDAHTSNMFCFEVINQEFIHCCIFAIHLPPYPAGQTGPSAHWKFIQPPSDALKSSQTCLHAFNTKIDSKAHEIQTFDNEANLKRNSLICHPSDFRHQS